MSGTTFYQLSQMCIFSLNTKNTYLLTLNIVVGELDDMIIVNFGKMSISEIRCKTIVSRCL